ncbi:ParA family protein [Prescottella subtropica]|uniref:ParA family protein n=1 Tax=Prescottella subtropica TaxID=2545757 RepID=UPI0010F56F6B|nr:ParA family protein [Prescottella subtropica]
MSLTIEVEITSPTTARATLANIDAPPQDLTVPEGESIGSAVHEFLIGIAADQGADVEVVYITKKGTRYMTVTPGGEVVTRTPSTPIPVVTAAPAPAVVERVSTPPAGPVTVTADPIPPAPAELEPAPAPAPAEPIAVASVPRPAVVPAAAAPEPQPRPQIPAQQPAAQTVPHPAPAPIPPQPAAVPTGPVTGPITGPVEVLSQLSAPRVNPTANDRAQLGLRGRVNAVLGLKLAPKADSLEIRLRGAQATITRRLPEGALVTVANVKGGVGKTPMAISLAETVAEHRGPATTACLDLGEIGGSFADRVAVPPETGQDVVSLIEGIDPGSEVRPAALARYLTRQPAGSDILAGRVGATAPLSYTDAAAAGAILGRHREVIVADTGNASLSGGWQWAIASAHAVIVPVPLRRDAAKGAQHALADLAAARPDLLARTVVVITDGPGDAPVVETEAVDAFTALGVRVCRMPYEPLFASGERIPLTQLRRETRAALTVLAATVVDLMAGAE